MANTYRPVQWNRQKIHYDLVLAAIIFLFLGVFIGLQLSIHPNITIETLIIRSSALIAIVLLHLVLMIGPLCRLNSAFLPLLYNRRHLGVILFLFAAIHGIFNLIQFHSLGNVGILESLFTSNTKYTSLEAFPFQVLGFFALIILLLMAASSHDFWLKNLKPSVWKSLHMGVYLAYGLVVLHVALGILQYETHPVYWAGLVLGFSTLSTLHLSSGIKALKTLKDEKNALVEEGYHAACTVDEIPENCAKSVFITDQNIAVYRYNNQISAVHNVCKHQMGPLAEGQIVDGCITCPWHGYQYHPENGQSPAPFDEKLATYATKVVGRTVWVNPRPFDEGTAVEPAKIK